MNDPKHIRQKTVRVAIFSLNVRVLKSHVRSDIV